MNPSMADKLSNVHPQMLKADSEGLRKKLAVGRAVERALELLGMTKQEAAFAMGYTDAGTVSRWCSASERPLFDKLFGIERFEECYIVALAEKNARMQVEMIVTIRRTA